MTSQDLKREIMERKLSLIGYAGLSNIYHALKCAQENGLDGDFVETGAWKGGAALYARSVMNELGMTGKVYVCDSFKGLPPPDTDNYPLDEGDGHHLEPKLAISKEEVESYFKEYNLLEGVEFIEGWFKDTMPTLAKKTKDISVLRLDGDMYESTMQVLEALYDKVPVAGLVIVDDYLLDRCKWAIDDFYKKRGLTEEIKRVDHTGIAIWQKERI